MQEEKRVIKRYRNRKLYDMLDSCYVTLEDIAELIRNGEDVTVVDNRTGKDMTSVTLAQIILEEEKHKSEHLPLTTLFQLVRSGGGVIREFVQRSIVDGVQNNPAVRNELQNLRKKLEDLEKRLTAKPTK